MATSRTLLLAIGLLAVLRTPARAREDAPADATAVLTLTAVVRAPRVVVLDRPSEAGFVCCQLGEGDALRVLVDRPPGVGWIAIAPPATAIVWVAESRLELETPRSPGVAPTNGWVRRPGAVVRAGNPGAKLPGPPRGRLTAGTRVQLVDRPPFVPAGDASATRWVAIVPPTEMAFYVRVDDVDWPTPSPPRPPIAEVRASYEEPSPGAKGPAWPADVKAELDRLDGQYRVVVSSQPIEQWHFEGIRAGYQRLLKQSGEHAGLEDALRDRLARLTRHEQAARAARTIEGILAKSHRRDHDVAALRRDLARLEQSRVRAYDAVGFIQPSVRRADGHKLFALIGGEGKTIAYLDVPPGLDPDPFLARRVGVRGQARFSADLGTRLITVRDLESVETR